MSRVTSQTKPSKLIHRKWLSIVLASTGWLTHTAILDSSINNRKSSLPPRRLTRTCPHEPLGSMVAIYTTETREYDKAWEAIHQALKAGRLIAPELIDRLKKESGRPI